MAARLLVHAPCPVLLLKFIVHMTNAKSKKNGPTSTPIANELFENGPIMHEQLATRFIGPFFFCASLLTGRKIAKIREVFADPLLLNKCARSSSRGPHKGAPTRAKL